MICKEFKGVMPAGSEIVAIKKFAGGSTPMRKIAVLMACFSLILINGVATAGSFCSGPEFTEDQIKEIIRRERFVRDDLRDQPADVQITIKRDRCHYVYMEFGSLLNLTYKVNQYGVIVSERVSH